MARGSGTAAILLFLHIALTGYLGFSMLYVLSSWDSGLISAPAMSWQYFFPAALAVLSYFPTDPLTRTVARVAAAAGAIALLLPFGIICVREVLRPAGASPLLQQTVLNGITGILPGLLAAEWFRLRMSILPPPCRRTIWPFYKLSSSSARLALASIWLAVMLLLTAPAFRHPAATAFLMLLSATLILSRTRYALR
jgi:hypothetical protein